LISATADSISIQLFETVLDGSEIITEYELFVNEGSTSTTYNEVTSYDSFSSTHTVTVAVDSLIAGTIYKFKYRAINLYGESDWSEELNAGVSSLPLQPNQVRKVESQSGETHITLEWDTSLDTELPVIGYSLKINDGVGGDVYTDVFAGGSIFPNVKKYIVGNLETGMTYGFTLETLNFNGPSDASEPAFFIICTKPKELAAATIPSFTRTTMTLAWLAPNITGGCPITSYSIY
jgi:hypothetical protein